MMRIGTTSKEQLKHLIELDHSLVKYKVKRDEDTGIYLEDSLPEDAPETIIQALVELVAWQKKQKKEDDKYPF